MKRLRVLALFHTAHLPRESQSADDTSEYKIDDRLSAGDLIGAVQELGHEVRVLGVEDELLPIREAIEEFAPHVVLNQLLEFHGAALYDAHVVSYLELLKTPYTGCNPRGLLLASDKSLSKKILTYHRVRTPRFAVVHRGRKARVARLVYPMIVKSGTEHASLGISQASIVNNETGLAKRVEFVHERIGTDAIVEEYVEGRELTVSLVGNKRLTAFPPWELRFGDLPEGTAPIATSRLKWNLDYQHKLGVTTGPADLTEDERRGVLRIAKRVYRVLGLSGYGRIDFRLDESGRPFVLEANPNPDLTLGEDFAESAKAAGVSYPRLLGRILTLGLAYEPGWMQE